MKDLLEIKVHLENVALYDLEVLLERLAKWDLLEVKAMLERVVKNMTREMLVVLDNKEL